MNIVTTDKPYTFELLKQTLSTLATTYPFLQLQSIRNK